MWHSHSFISNSYNIQNTQLPGGKLAKAFFATELCERYSMKRWFHNCEKRAGGELHYSTRGNFLRRTKNFFSASPWRRSNDWNFSFSQAFYSEFSHERSKNLRKTFTTMIREFQIFKRRQFRRVNLFSASQSNPEKLSKTFWKKFKHRLDPLLCLPARG